MYFNHLKCLTNITILDATPHLPVLKEISPKECIVMHERITTHVTWHLKCWVFIIKFYVDLTQQTDQLLKFIIIKITHIIIIASLITLAALIPPLPRCHRPIPYRELGALFIIDEFIEEGVCIIYVC